VGHFKHAIKEIRINVASQDPTDYHLLIIATAIEKTCLGSIPLKRTVKMRSEGPTFLRRYDATLLEQVGSISLRIGNHQPPQYIWNVAQMFLDRTYHIDYFWQGNRQFVTQLLKRRTENGLQREVHQPHKTLPQKEKNQIPGFEYHFVVKRSEGREEAYEPLPTMAAGKYAYGRFRGSVQYQRY
jgi:hypothetical protein